MAERPQLSPALPSSPGVATDERTRLVEILDFYRAVLARKGSGLTAEQLNSPLPTSDLTLGGLIYHTAMVEDSWFTWDFAGQPPPEPWASADRSETDFELAAAKGLTPEQIFGQFDISVARSRAVIESAESMDQLSVRTTEDDQHWNLRWIMVHMIEEYARHCGHADLIRQSIDGVTGN